MGTRSLTHIKDKDEVICTIYRQMDGYPDGHGTELAEFLMGFKIVNGINMDDEEYCPKLANGMGCLAAQIVAHFKTDVEHYRKMRELRNEMKKVYTNQGVSSHQDSRVPVDRKFRVGSFYLTTPGGSGMWEDYTYTVYLDEGRKLKLKVMTDKDVLFDDEPENWSLGDINEKMEQLSEES